MTRPPDEASWDELARFAERRFTGVSDGVVATVDGTLSVTGVTATDFHPRSAPAIRDAINRALLAARAALAHHLATTTELDLPEPLRALLAGAAEPDADALLIPRDYEASRAGVIVHVEGSKCLVSRVVVPSESHLSLLPTVANAALAAAESRRVIPLDELFDSSWTSIVAQLDDLDNRLDELLAELGHNQD